jgi:hypothetical protein
MIALTHQTHQNKLFACSRTDLAALCWLAASLALAVLQLRLFVSLLTLDHAPLGVGTLIGLLALSWTLGVVLGRGWSPQGSTCLWSGLTLAVTLSCLWIVLPYLSLLQAQGRYPELVILLAACVCVTATAAVSTAWMSATRRWTSGHTCQLLATGLPVVALCLVWFWPVWSNLVACVGLLPLLALDTLPDTWYPVQPEQKTITIEPEGARLSGWEQRRMRTLVLLSLLVEVLLGALFSVLPTCYALQLFQQQQQSNLLWLLAGQISALLLCLLAFPRLRNLAGISNSLPLRQQRGRAIRVATVALLGAGGGLFALSDAGGVGLAVSFCGYAIFLVCWQSLVSHLLTGSADDQKRQRWQTTLTCLLIPAILVPENWTGR